MISHGRRWKYAFRAFFSLIFHGRIGDDILAALNAERPPAAVTPDPAESGYRAVQMLALLQREGRLVDFLMEDLTAYPDAQVGAAVRDVHAGCRQALGKYAALTPVMDEAEGATVTLQPGIDPVRVKVVGYRAGPPPFTGVLRHRGWEAAVTLPPLPGTGRSVVAPAEIEIA